MSKQPMPHLFYESLSPVQRDILSRTDTFVLSEVPAELSLADRWAGANQVAQMMTEHTIEVEIARTVANVTQMCVDSLNTLGTESAQATAEDLMATALPLVDAVVEPPNLPELPYYDPEELPESVYWEQMKADPSYVA